jgi:outer membrane protein OmpA-like peptidoglycan-associated protein
MAHLASSRPFPRPHVLTLALLVSLLPLTEAVAQTLPQVRVTGQPTTVSSFRHFDDDDFVITDAAPGTVLEVIFTEGDVFRHLESNWYWVLLPRDVWGTKRAGWISGRYVAPVPPAERREAEPPSDPAPAPPVEAVREEPRPAEPQPESAPVVEAMPELAGVVVRFAFDKSDLSDDAKARLSQAVMALKTHAEMVTFALEGHADATGREAYNEKLGLARAESVKRYLLEQHEIAIEKVSVVSYGETQPAAPNTTKDGRAQNRRVVLKVGR